MQVKTANFSDYRGSGVSNMARPLTRRIGHAPLQLKERGLNESNTQLLRLCLTIYLRPCKQESIEWTHKLR